MFNPTMSDVRTDLGTAYWYTGDADKAIASFEKALAIGRITRGRCSILVS